MLQDGLSCPTAGAAASLSCFMGFSTILDSPLLAPWSSLPNPPLPQWFPCTSLQRLLAGTPPWEERRPAAPAATLADRQRAATCSFLRLTIQRKSGGDNRSQLCQLYQPQRGNCRQHRAQRGATPTFLLSCCQGWAGTCRQDEARQSLPLTSCFSLENRCDANQTEIHHALGANASRRWEIGGVCLPTAFRVGHKRL